MTDRPYPADATPKLYDELAAWFHLLTAPEDYAEEAAWIAAVLESRVRPAPRTALELGSGGGNLASHLGSRLELTLTDLSSSMLELSKSINPGRDHLQGDMRTLRLGRLFDAVIVHDAVTYMTTLEDVARVVATGAAHLRSEGALIVLPDEVCETFAPSTSCGGHDGGGRGLRFVEWTWDPDPDDTTLEVDFACILREADGSTRVVHDRHRVGLFAREDWLSTFRSAGLEVECLRDPWERDVFVGLR